MKAGELWNDSCREEPELIVHFETLEEAAIMVAGIHLFADLIEPEEAKDTDDPKFPANYMTGQLVDLGFGWDVPVKGWGWNAPFPPKEWPERYRRAVAAFRAVMKEGG